MVRRHHQTHLNKLGGVPWQPATNQQIIQKIKQQHNNAAVLAIWAQARTEEDSTICQADQTEHLNQ
jgi:hypothetical protein